MGVKFVFLRSFYVCSRAMPSIFGDMCPDGMFGIFWNHGKCEEVADADSG